MSDEPSKLPEKLYYRIGEVASLVGVEPHVLRYWEREFRTIRPKKSARGQRVYSRRDVETLMRVRELLYSEGFTIAGARRRLQQERSKEDGVMPASMDEVEPNGALEASAESEAGLDADLDDGLEAERDDAAPQVTAAPESEREANRAKRSSRTDVQTAADRSLPLFEYTLPLGPTPRVERQQRDEQEVAAAPPPLADRRLLQGHQEVRAVLRELRGEIESFLDELG
jgi:DNA-binding transcriptional MerR regulator